ncbi:hypothetical protein [Rhizobium terrae]|uniref:hypothetical protein n=1 Tax=Rhizobium terrae TaxID=2171756 RepID=UPI000E3E7D2D|nr:hypothetical protein [Rhizobium terrae]
MKHLIMILSTLVLLSGCSDDSEKQSDPINNTPPPQPSNTAPVDRSPTPQSGTGGQSPTTSPSGTTNTAPGNNPPPAATGKP